MAREGGGEARPGSATRVLQRDVSQRIEWLLQEGAAERRIPSSDRIVIDGNHTRAITERIDIAEDMRVFLTSAEVRRALTVTAPHSVTGAWLAANVVASGRIELEMTDGQRTAIDASQSVLFRSADKVSRYVSEPGRPLRLAGYMIRSDRVARILGDAEPDVVRRLTGQTVRASILVATRADAGQRRLAASLFSDVLHGPMRRLFLEGGALQLLAMQASAAGSAPSPREAARHLTALQRERIEAARRILLAEMRVPPTLGELAAKTGLGEKALNAGFRLLYGATVFETLRNERLEHARLALETGAVPMKVIAYGVGYNHVTNFISAFTRRYGVPPKAYLRSGERG